MMTIRVDCIETRITIDTTDMEMSKSFIEASKVKVVFFTILDRSGRTRHRPYNFISLPDYGDHGCSFDFVEGGVYKLPAVLRRFPYAGIRMFKEGHYHIDCKDLPVKHN